MSQPNSEDKLSASWRVTSAVILRIKLIWRLMHDRRVSFWLKTLPVLSLIYLFNPVDLPTPLDDAAVIGIGFTAFVYLCPQDVVQEHMSALQADGHMPEAQKQKEEDVIEGSYRTIHDTRPNQDSADSDS